jgi:hypothetical protein
MAIRLRTVNGIRVALCAVESDEMPGDVYLDDGDHYALAAKFCRDWQGAHEFIDWQYPTEWAAMDTQKKRGAAEVHAEWAAAVDLTRAT